MDISDPTLIDTTKPHSARIYDYFLRGKNHYPADEEAAEALTAIWPSIRLAARHNRAFMHRAIRYLAAEAGIRQFLDIGAGIPTEPNLHQIAQEAGPTSRVLYVDNDPIVLVHAEALLRSTPEGRVAYLHADVTDPESILQSHELDDTLDLRQPVAVSLISLLHFLPDECAPHDIVRRLMAALPAGSHLVISHATADLNPERMRRVGVAYRSAGDCQHRSHTEILGFFSGMTLADPGLVVTRRWRPDPSQNLQKVSDADVSTYAAVARKP